MGACDLWRTRPMKSSYSLTNTPFSALRDTDCRMLALNLQRLLDRKLDNSELTRKIQV